MLATNSMQTFVRANGDQLRYMVANLCMKHRVQNVDDMIQEVYSWFLERDILNKFDPNYVKNGKGVKLSTFLYSVIENVVRDKKAINEDQVCNDRFTPSIRRYKTGGECVDDTELALRHNDMAVEYENITKQNDLSDNFESLGADIQDFEERFLPTENKVYTLSRRRDKELKTKGTSLVEVFRLFKQGYSSREVSRMFGISDMFASNMKQEIAVALRAYGLGPKSLKRRKRIKKDSPEV